MPKLRTIALLARRPGVLVLENALIQHPKLEIVTVFSHRKLPKAEGEADRQEVSEFETICKRSEIPLRWLDYPEAGHLESYLPDEPIDLLIVLNWRFLISKSVLDRLQLGGINIHRGALPEYAGAEPVRHAIEAGERRVAITAHKLIPIIDAGPPLAIAWIDIPPLPSGKTSHEYAATVRDWLEPIYAPLTLTAIAALQAQR